MVKGPHIQLRWHPPVFHNFTWFNIMAAITHDLIIQEVNELLAKGSTEACMGGAGFYSTLSNLIALNMYLLLRCLPLDRYCTLFKKVIMLFLLISVMLIYLFLLLSITIIFYALFDNSNHFSGIYCHLGFTTSPRVSLHLLNSYYSFAAVRFVIL